MMISNAKKRKLVEVGIAMAKSKTASFDRDFVYNCERYLETFGDLTDRQYGVLYKIISKWKKGLDPEIES